MSAEDRRAVTADDEARHEPDADPLWNESYYLDLVASDHTVGGYVRLGFYPNLGVVWWTTALVRVGGETIMSVAYDLTGAPMPALAAHGGGVDVTLTVTDPLRTFRVEATAPGIAYEDPADAYGSGDGRPVDLAMDLTWTTDGVPYHYDVTTRYEIPCLVAGSVTIDGERFEIDGQGQRDHSWGVRDWWAFGWCWLAARLDDGTRLHAADIRIPGMPVALGYVQAPGSVEAISELTVTEELGRLGMPTAGRAMIEPGGVDVAIEPVAFGPLVLTATDGRVSNFPRAMARFTTVDGRTGMGWIEWNQPQGDTSATG
jgi:hypothetical protein